MTGIKIIGTGMYAPEFVVDNDDMSKIVDTNNEWIIQRTGMQRRHVSLGEPAWKMGEKAAIIAMETAGVSPLDIDVILVTTVTSDYYFPSTACMIQNAIGANNAFAYDISVACSGITYTLDMAWRYLCTGDVKTVLLVGAENLTQHVDYTDRASCILFGDAAAALVVRAGDNPFASYLHTDASGIKATYNKRIRQKLPFDNVPDGTVDDLYPDTVSGYMYLNGREVYKFATKALPYALSQACAKMNLEPKDLDLIIPHQANRRILETAAKNMKVSMDKLYINIEEYANTSSASIPICMDEGIRSGRIKRGDMIGLVGFGGGLSLGANVFQY